MVVFNVFQPHLLEEVVLGMVILSLLEASQVTYQRLPQWKISCRTVRSRGLRRLCFPVVIKDLRPHWFLWVWCSFEEIRQETADNGLETVDYLQKNRPGLKKRQFFLLLIDVFN